MADPHEHEQPPPEASAPDATALEGEDLGVEIIGAGDGTDDTDTAGETYVPPMLLVIFGLPIFLTLIWFFLRFTAPDRFGRVDRRLVENGESGDEPSEDGDGADADDEAEEDPPSS